MAKFAEKLHAQKLRKDGESIKVIARQLGVAKGTVSVWCRDIRLTSAQVCALNLRIKHGSYAGRLKHASQLYEDRLQREYFLEKEGENMIGKISRRGFFILGLGLYVGEGHKQGNGLGFTNSDPVVIQFMIRWFQEFWGISKDRFMLWISINESHEDRKDEVEQYWADRTGIPKVQFYKTYLKKSALRKVYKDRNTYHGTLQIRIRRSKCLLSQMKGLIRGIFNVAG